MMLRRLRARWLDLSLARKGIVVAAVPVMTLLIAAIPVIQNDIARSHANDAIKQTNNARRLALTAMLRMREAENRVLAYIMTGDSGQFLHFRDAAHRAVNDLNDSELQLAASHIQAVHDAYLQTKARVSQVEVELEYEAQQAMRRVPNVVERKAMFEQEARTMLALRSAVDSLVTMQDAVLVDREATLGNERRRRIWLAGLVLLLGIGGTALSAVLYTFGVAARVERVQHHAAAPADETELSPITGTDEIGQLAATIEENRYEVARLAERLKMAIRAAHIEVIEFRPEDNRLTLVGSGNLFRRLGNVTGEMPATLPALLQRIHPDDRDRVAEAIDNRTPGWEYVVEFRMAVGADWRWMELRGAVSPVDAETVARLAESGDRGPVRPGTVGILLDVTERKMAEEQVKLAMTAADLANKAKSEFLSRMSHELRTPLNAVLGFAQLLEIGTLTADQRDSLSHILRGGRYLLNLINEVLDLSRIEAGRLGLVIESLPLREVISSVAALISPQAAEFGVHLNVAPPEDDNVRADRQRLQQVLLNLLSNAVKYNKRGGTVELSTSRIAGRVRISVKDTGPGLTHDQIDRLFQPFERLDAARTGIEGTGLGLALSRTIVESMGGRIVVESSPGVGSTFTVELDEAKDEADEFDVSSNGPRKGQINVVYVEDNEANVKLVERIVARRPSLRLMTTGDGDKAVEMIRAEKPALVLLDLNLPGISGDVILQKLRADPATATIPVAILSADATPSQIVRLVSMGAQYYLTKPIDVNVLLQVLDSTIADAAAAVA